MGGISPVENWDLQDGQPFRMVSATSLVNPRPISGQNRALRFPTWVASYKRKYHGGSGNSWRSGIVMDRPMGENMASSDRIPKLCGLWVYHVNTKIIIFPIKIAMRGEAIPYFQTHPYETNNSLSSGGPSSIGPRVREKKIEQWKSMKVQLCAISFLL